MSAAAGPVFDRSFCDMLETLLVWRRDVRRFRPDPIDPSLIAYLLTWAGHAPSVGYSQPWRFVLVESAAARQRIRDNFAACNREALEGYTSERAQRYAKLKLAGLDDAPVQLAVFAETNPESGHGLGRRTMPETLHYSVVTAVHTLWLVARAHGVGVGWVSILDPRQARESLEVPASWDLVAYLCIGYPEEAQSQPELYRNGWQSPDPGAGQLHRR